MTTDDLKMKIDRARWWSLQNQPFYGQLAMSLSDRIEPVGTACTDGKSISWDPGFLDRMTDEETRYVLLHETLHCAHMHLWRIQPDQIGNIAGDYEIEHVLRGMRGTIQPVGGLTCPTEFDGKPIETIDATLRANAKKQAQQPSEEQGDDSPADQDDQEQGDDSNDIPDAPSQGNKGTGTDSDVCGRFSKPAAPISGKQSDSLNDQWQRAVVQAAFSAAMSRGSVPADIKSVLADIRRPATLDWRQEMAEFVRSSIGTRNDWSRCARRHAHQRVIYPRRQPEPGIVVYIRDTSGSIDLEAASEFAACVSDALSIADGIVIDADTAVQAELRLGRGDSCPLETGGGGGTDFTPAFQRVQELIDAGEPIAGVVYLTDLDAPPVSPDDWTESVPTLWIATPVSCYVTIQLQSFGRVVPIGPR